MNVETILFYIALDFHSCVQNATVRVKTFIYLISGCGFFAKILIPCIWRSVAGWFYGNFIFLLWFEQGTYILYQGLTVRLFIQYWKHNIYEAMMFIFYWIHRIISFITTMCYDQQQLFKKLRLTWQSYGLDCLSIFSRKKAKENKLCSVTIVCYTVLAINAITPACFWKLFSINKKLYFCT